MIYLTFGQSWVYQSRVGQSLVGCPLDSLFTVEQQRRLLESVSPGLDEEEPGEDNEEDLDAGVNEIVAPRFPLANGPCEKLTNCFQSDWIDVLVER